MVLILISKGFALCEITQLEKNLCWNFLATDHGKGDVDGIGGTLKRNLNIIILSQNIVIKNIDSLYDI